GDADRRARGAGALDLRDLSAAAAGGGTMTAALAQDRPAAAARQRRRGIRVGRVGLYLFLLSAALFFLTPLYIMVVTSLKTMAEIRTGSILALPAAPTLEPWVEAWSTAC